MRIIFSLQESDPSSSQRYIHVPSRNTARLLQLIFRGVGREVSFREMLRIR